MAFDIGKAGYGKPVSNLEKIQKIPLDKIQRNKKNFYDTSKVEDLMDSIRMVGLLDPVRVVAMDGGSYRLISGHRRFAAYEHLYMETLPEQTYAKIPALVLEGMDDLTENFMLITANSTARELTYDEKLQQEQQLRETLMAMKEAGMEVPSNLGQYIANQIGVSRNEVSRMHSVNDNLIPEAREKVKAGEMTAQQAYEMSRKPKAEQMSCLDSSLDQLDAITLSTKVKKALPFVLGRMRGGYYSRADVLNNLKDIGRQWWSCGGRGVSIRTTAAEITIDGTTVKWTKFVDCLLAEVVDAAIQERKTEKKTRRDVAPDMAKWTTGDPVEDGTYAARFRGGACHVETRRILFWYNGCWNLFNVEEGCPIHEGAEVLGWIRLPDADDENEEEVSC